MLTIEECLEIKIYVHNDIIMMIHDIWCAWMLNL